MRFFVSGLLNIETTVAVRGFPIQYYPIDYPFFGVSSHVSGVGYNIAKALTALQDEVRLSSFTGRDPEADRILAQLAEDGLETGLIRQALKSTPVSVVLYDPQGKRQIYCDLKDIQEQLLSPAGLTKELQSCDMAVLCNINFNRELIRTARQQGVTTATDVHVLSDLDDDYNRDFMTNADILFLSDERLPCPAEQFIRQLHERYHNRIIVIGMGAKGALLLENGKATMVPAYTGSKIVNTTGAGDALFAAFLHFYAKMSDAGAALQRAVIFAGIKIGFNGASIGFCTEQEVEKTLKRS